MDLSANCILKLWDMHQDRGCKLRSQGRFSEAAKAFAKAHNEARCLLGLSWQNSLLARQAALRLTETAKQAAQMMAEQHKTSPTDRLFEQQTQAAQYLLTQCQPLCAVISNTQHPLPLRFHLARTLGAYVGLMEQMTMTDRQHSQVALLRDEILKFWRVEHLGRHGFVSGKSD